METGKDRAKAETDANAERGVERRSRSRRQPDPQSLVDADSIAAAIEKCEEIGPEGGVGGAGREQLIGGGRR